MKKLIIFLLILFFFSITFLSTQEKELIKSGKQYLVVIAIDKYKNRLPLRDRVNGAKKIKNMLFSKYEIDELIELYDYEATHIDIKLTLSDLIKRLKNEDSLIIYYSGHSYVDKKTNETYWLPYDAGINEYEKELWMSNTELISQINKINAKQIFVISDSTFNTSLLNIESIQDNQIFSNEYFINSYSKKSRQFLCSGELETSIIKTDFSEELYNALKRLNKNYVDPVMIYNEIKNRINKSNPVYGVIENIGHQKSASLVLFERSNQLSIKNLEAIDREKELAKEKEKDTEKEVIIKEKIVRTKNFTPFRDLHPINKAGRVLMPVSAPVFGCGLILLGVDFAYMFTVLDNEIHSGVSYEDYVRAYRTHIIMFITAVAVSSVGLTGMIISIPLLAYKEGWFNKFKERKNLSLNLNMDLNSDLSLFLNYKF